MIDCPNSVICSVIDERINGRHAARNRAILKERLIDGTPFEPLAEEFGISTRQCKRIVYTCMEHLSKYI